MDKICDLRFKIREKATAAILRMMGYDINKLKKEEIEKLLQEYMEQYFFNQQDYTVLKAEITDI